MKQRNEPLPSTGDPGKGVRDDVMQAVGELLARLDMLATLVYQYE